MNIAEVFPQNDLRYRIFSNNPLREEVIEEIGQFVRYVAIERPDVLVYLDKSARPVSWAFNRIWKEVFPEELRPETKYLNVGREKVLPFEEAIDPATAPLFGVGAEAVKEVRRVYAKHGATGAALAETHLDGKKVCLIDEFTATGASLLVTRSLLTRAIGEDRLAAPITCWTVFSEEPVWYQNKYMVGVEERGYGEFLTCRPDNPRNSRQLREELGWVAAEVIERMRS